MTVSEASFLLESYKSGPLRPFPTGEELQRDMRRYMDWYKSLPYEIQIVMNKKETKQYEDAFYFMGREDYTGLCEHCGQKIRAGWEKVT